MWPPTADRPRSTRVSSPSTTPAQTAWQRRPNRRTASSSPSSSRSCRAEPPMSINVIGVDAYALGWVGVELRDGSFGRAVLASTLYEIVAGSSGAAVVGVDIPLGMLPGRRAGGRHPGRRPARAPPGQPAPRRSSVFRVPPRAVWLEPDFAAANRLCRDLTGAGLSRQSWALR